ncbi:MAG: HD domain-containing protein [Fimbriimonadaceae bacterium]|nr:HD domain-containing protein [Fimbriimonadaceae bacterium]
MTQSGSRLTTVLLVCGVAAGVGGIVCAILAHQFRAYAFSSEMARLTTSARLVSASLSDLDHRAIVTSKGKDASRLASQRTRLREAFSQTDGIANVYTVTKLPTGYFAVLDAKYTGDPKSSEADAYAFLTPVDRRTDAMVETFNDATAHFSPKPYRDRRGTWYAGYAPIVGRDGTIDSIVVVERNREAVDNTLRAVTGDIGNIALIIAAVSGFFLIVSLRKISWVTEIFRMKLKAAKSRRIIVGALLVGTALVIGVEAISAAPALIQNSRQRQIVQQELNGIAFAQEALSALGRSEPAWRSKAETAIGLLRPTTLPWVVTGLTGLMSDQPLRSRQETAKKFERSLERENRLRQGLLTELTESDQSLTERMQRTLIGTAVLAFVCLLVLRASTIQDQTIAAAIDHTARIEREYKRVIDTMPIGMFVFTKEAVEYANSEHEKLFSKWEEGQSLTTHLERVFEPDKEGVLRCLADSSETEKPAILNYRIVRPLGDTGYVQTRIVPIFDVFGTFQQMLGFTIDMTENVLAQSEIKRSHAELTEKNVLLEDAIQILESNLNSFVKAMVRAIEAKDIYTAGHSERVTAYSLAIAEELNLSDELKHIISTGAMVHDIGKIGIPGSLLTKPSGLTPEERAIVQRHPVVGATILSGVPAFEPCLGIIRHHHERLNGTGYPDKLDESQIPIEVRIVSAADAFDAMTSQRSYRKGMDLSNVFRELEKDVREHRLDPHVVAALKQVIRVKGIIGQKPDETRATAA